MKADEALLISTLSKNKKIDDEYISIKKHIQKEAEKGNFELFIRHEFSQYTFDKLKEDGYSMFVRIIGFGYIRFYVVSWEVKKKKTNFLKKLFKLKNT